jgi:hypothetical protein
MQPARAATLLCVRSLPMSSTAPQRRRLRHRPSRSTCAVGSHPAGGPSAAEHRLPGRRAHRRLPLTKPLLAVLVSRRRRPAARQRHHLPPHAGQLRRQQQLLLLEQDAGRLRRPQAGVREEGRLPGQLEQVCLLPPARLLLLRDAMYAVQLAVDAPGRHARAPRVACW